MTEHQLPPDRVDLAYLRHHMLWVFDLMTQAIAREDWAAAEHWCQELDDLTQNLQRFRQDPGQFLS